MANQSSVMRSSRSAGGLDRREVVEGHGTVLDLTCDEREKEQPQYEVQTGESDERKERCPGVYGRTRAFRRTQDAVDDPRLPTELRRHPSSCRRNIRKWKREHERPQQRATAGKPTTPFGNGPGCHEQDQE